MTSDLEEPAFRAAVYDRLGLMIDNEFDYIPDAFSFNFGEYGGSFFFGNDGQVHCSEFNTLKFEEARDSNNDIIAWVVIDDKGLIYHFDQIEKTQTFLQSGSMPQYNSAWYLSSITNPSTNTVATFEYDNADYSYMDSETSRSYTYKQVFTGQYHLQPFSPSSSSTTNSNLKFLSQIEINDNVISFSASSAFQSPINENDFRRLDEVIWTNNSISERRFLFDIDLYDKSGTTAEHKRQRLNSIVETDESSETIKEFAFEYYGGTVPKRNDFGQDHWGFYNGKTNSSLVPDETFGGQVYATDGADRSVNFGTTKIGMLSKVVYPTGGETSFTYELNKYKGLTNEDDIKFTVGSEIVEVDGISYSTQNCETRNVDSAAPSGTTYDAEINYKLLQIENDDNMGQDYPTLDVYAYDGATEIFHETITMEEEIIYEGVFTGISGASHYKLELCAIGEVQHARLEYAVNEYDPAGIGQPIGRDVGGLRISQIAKYDPINDKTEYKTYDYGMGGYLVWSLPYYLRQSLHATQQLDQQGIPVAQSRVERGMFTIGASSTRGLSPSSLPLAYEEVTEYNGTATSNIGGTTTTYMKVMDGGSVSTVQESKAWKRSKPIRQQFFDASGTVIREVQNQYSSKIYLGAQGFRATKMIILSQVPRDYLRDFSYKNFNFYTERSELMSTKTLEISATDTLITESFFEFGSERHSNLTDKIVISSLGDSLKTNYVYPIDLSSVSSSCYEDYLLDLDDLDNTVNQHALESTACNALYKPCIDNWVNCKTTRYVAIMACFDSDGFNRDCMQKAWKENRCGNILEQCLDDNDSYYECTGDLSLDFELEQKQAFTSYIQCQETYEYDVLSEYDSLSTSEYQPYYLMNRLNRLREPVVITSSNNSNEMTKIENKYSVHILPRNGTVGDSEISLPESSILTLKGVDSRTLISVNEYDDRGNPIEVFDNSQGILKTYVWGYGGTRLVAQIVGASANDVAGALLNTSVIDYPSNDLVLRAELAKLYQTASLDNALITTYTYNLMDGVTSQMDPNGRLTKYEYHLGKLKRIVDHDYNVMQEYEYKYLGTE